MTSVFLSFFISVNFNVGWSAGIIGKRAGQSILLGLCGGGRNNIIVVVIITADHHHNHPTSLLQNGLLAIKSHRVEQNGWLSNWEERVSSRRLTGNLIKFRGLFITETNQRPPRDFPPFCFSHSFYLENRKWWKFH